MDLPTQIGVMTLPNAVLFPHDMLPLYIFEPRYRNMLADAVESTRMFCVARQEPGALEETPARVAGIGIIRAAVEQNDGTSHLILQGYRRVVLKRLVQLEPYRIHEIEPVNTEFPNEGVIDTLTSQIRELVRTHFEEGTSADIGIMQAVAALEAGGDAPDLSPASSVELFQQHLEGEEDPERMADLVTCALIKSVDQRQMVLETVDLKSRLTHLIRFLSENSSHGTN